MTVSRRALVQALVAGEHLRDDDLAAQVQALHPDVHMTSVSRTLDALEEVGDGSAAVRCILAVTFARPVRE